MHALRDMTCDEATPAACGGDVECEVLELSLIHI